jgi:hypothetical protein
MTVTPPPPVALAETPCDPSAVGRAQRRGAVDEGRADDDLGHELERLEHRVRGEPDIDLTLDRQDPRERGGVALVFDLVPERGLVVRDERIIRWPVTCVLSDWLTKQPPHAEVSRASTRDMDAKARGRARRRVFRCRMAHAPVEVGPAMRAHPVPSGVSNETRDFREVSQA